MYYEGAPVGLHPVRNILNASPNFATRHFPIVPVDEDDPDTQADIFCGSPITLAGGCDENGQPYVRLAKPGERLLGAVVGFDLPDYRGDNLPHYKAGCDCDVGVILAEGASTVYTMWVDAPTDADADMLCGEFNIDFTAESQQCGASLSNVMLDLATISSDMPLPLKLIRRVRSDWSRLDASDCGGNRGEYWEVVINNHYHDSPTAGV